MNQTPFHKFIQLVQIDKQIYTLNQTIARIEAESHAVLERSNQNDQMIKQSQARTRQMQHEVAVKEEEMKLLDAQELKKKESLERVANHREYQALKADIDILKKQQHNLEDLLIAAWNTLENAKKDLANSEIEYNAKKVAYEHQRADFNQQIEALRKEINQELKQREDAEKTVPREWLDKYAVMRSRVVDPVVPVINGICSACFYQISLQDLQNLDRNKLSQCKDCFRLLYAPQQADDLLPKE